MAEGTKKRRFRLPRRVRILVSLGLLLFVGEYLVLPQFATARKSLHLLTKVNPGLVVLAILCELLAIYSYMELTRTVLHPHSPSRWITLRVNLAGLAISHVVPGGTAPAGALSYRVFSDLGVPRETNAFGVAVQGSGSAVVLNALFWVALVISIPLRGFNPAYGFAALVGVFLLLAFFGTILLLTRGQRHADAWLRAIAARIPRVNPDQVSQQLARVADRVTLLIANRRTLWWAFTWAALNWLFDVACLWVFIWAFGSTLSPIDILVAYGLANILAAIPVTPAGLGVVEGVLITTIVGFGVPHGQAILAVIAYRLVNFWIPIPIGGLAYASLQLRKESTPLADPGPEPTS